MCRAPRAAAALQPRSPVLIGLRTLHVQTGPLRSAQPPALAAAACATELRCSRQAQLVARRLDELVEHVVVADHPAVLRHPQPRAEARRLVARAPPEPERPRHAQQQRHELRGGQKVRPSAASSIGAATRATKVPKMRKGEKRRRSLVLPSRLAPKLKKERREVSGGRGPQRTRRLLAASRTSGDARGAQALELEKPDFGLSDLTRDTEPVPAAQHVFGSAAALAQTPVTRRAYSTRSYTVAHRRAPRLCSSGPLQRPFQRVSPPRRVRASAHTVSHKTSSAVVASCILNGSARCLPCALDACACRRRLRARAHVGAGGRGRRRRAALRWSR